MNIADFEIQINRLKNVFGDKSYSPERVKLIWAEMRFIESNRFEKIVNALISAHRMPPMITDIRDEIAKERERSGRAQRHEIEAKRFNPNAKCDYCSDSGVYLAGKKDSPGVYGFRCYCDAGNSDPRKNIPQAKEEHIRQGFYWLNRMPTNLTTHSDVNQ